MHSLQEATVIVGTKQVLRCLELEELTRVYVARDADDALKRKIMAACEAAGVEIVHAESMLELGQRCRIDVGAACAGIKKGS